MHESSIWTTPPVSFAMLQLKFVFRICTKQLHEFKAGSALHVHIVGSLGFDDIDLLDANSKYLFCSTNRTPPLVAEL